MVRIHSLKLFDKFIRVKVNKQARIIVLVIQYFRPS